MDFYFRRSYRAPVKAIVLDWTGTAADYGSFAPTAVFLPERNLGLALPAALDVIEYRLEQGDRP